MDNFQASAFSLHIEGSRDWAQAFDSDDNQHLHPLIHLSVPHALADREPSIPRALEI